MQDLPLSGCRRCISCTQFSLGYTMYCLQRCCYQSLSKSIEFVNFINCLRCLVINSCLFIGQIPCFDVSLLSVSLDCCRRMQRYSRWSDASRCLISISCVYIYIYIRNNSVWPGEGGGSTYDGMVTGSKMQSAGLPGNTHFIQHSSVCIQVTKSLHGFQVLLLYLPLRKARRYVISERRLAQRIKRRWFSLSCFIQQRCKLIYGMIVFVPCTQ